MRRPRAGGGWKSIAYAFGRARRAGGLLRLYRALRSKNACKTCALGMGGQAGGMRNELGRYPEVCKKSIQAMAADMQGAIREHFFDDFSLRQLAGFTSRELEAAGRLVEPVFAGPLDGHFRRTRTLQFQFLDIRPPETERSIAVALALHRYRVQGSGPIAQDRVLVTLAREESRWVITAITALE